MFEFHLPKGLRKIRVEKHFKEDLEPQEVFLDSLAKRKEEEMGVSEKRLEVPLLQRILKGFLVFSFLLLLGLFFKTFQLQILEGKEYDILARENKFIVRQIQAERGVIYDSNLNQIVFNEPTFDLVVDVGWLPGEAKEKERIVKEVAEIVGRDSTELLEEVEQTSFQVLVSEDLDHKTLILLEAKIKDLPGFSIKNNTIRDYREGEVFSHLLGYTGKIQAEELKENPQLYSIADYVGRSGLENYYEEVLRKNPGKLQIERDALGNIISKEVIQLPESGNNLVLWLDSDLQRKIKQELEVALRSLGTEKAVAIAMDPKTGGILSLVSLPDFDNNLFQKGADSGKLQEVLGDSSEPLFNRAVSGKYLTGSVIKPLIASAALQEEIISSQKNMYCKGAILIQNPWDPSASSTKMDWSTHGWTDMRKAIAESCNVYFYTVGGGYENQEGLGPTKIKEYLELFGWGERTGIDLPGEAAGFIPDKYWKKETWDQSWWDGDTYNLAIGQGFLQITPLEIVSSFSAIANGGKLLQPQIVKEIVDGSGKVVEEKGVEVLRQDFISPENLQVVREGMRQAVSGINSPQASAVMLNSLPVAVAAKTGTAELGNGYYNNWITVMAPYEDPEIVLIIMTEKVKGIQEAVKPVARSVLNWYFTKEEK